VFECGALLEEILGQGIAIIISIGHLYSSWKVNRLFYYIFFCINCLKQSEAKGWVPIVVKLPHEEEQAADDKKR